MSSGMKRSTSVEIEPSSAPGSPRMEEGQAAVSEDAGVAAIMKEGKNSGFIIKLAVIASLSGLLFGYDTGVVSGALIFLRLDMDLSSLESEIIVSSTVLAAAIAAWFGHSLLDNYGRKRTLVFASVIFVIGSVVMSLGDYVILIIGRVIVGVAIGFASEAGPLYISECAPKHLRGSLTTLFNLAVVGGQVFASIVCGIFSYLPASYNWRLMLAFGAIPALIQMVGFMTLPYSPSWLVLKNRKDEAEQVLRDIRQEPPTPEGQEDPVTTELNEIVEEHETAKQGEHVSLWKLWTTNPPVRRAMILGCSLWAVSQLAGINTIMYYGAVIIRKAGFDGNRSFDIWITVPLFTMQLIGILVCFKIIDQKGRRWTLLTSMSMIALGLFVIALGFVIGSGNLTALAMCFYLFSFGLGLSTMPYTMNAEIYPTEYRGHCVAQSTAVFWLSNFVVSVTFLSLMRATSEAATFFLYTGIVVASGIWFYFLVPETSGLSLHEIQALFESPNGNKSTNDGDDASDESSELNNTPVPTYV